MIQSKNQINIRMVVLVIAGLVLCVPAHARTGVFGKGQITPRVEYLQPANQSEADLTGKETLLFSWREVPIPAGGREMYRFTLYKGFGYKVVMTKDIDERTFSIEVPADKFEDGETYTWRVKQRDGKTLVWSLYDTWSFKVIKKESKR